MLMYATPTFITEALHLATQDQQLLNSCYSELTSYTVLVYYYIGLVSMMHINAKAMPIKVVLK